MRSNTKRLLDALGIKVTDIVTHSMGGMVASRFASSYPDAVGNLAMINQIGLTDARSTRPWRDTSEVYKAALARDYAEIVRGMRAYYVNWKPEYMKYVKIHYGWIKSGDWPRMAMVRALQQQAIYADPVVDDWPRIKARTLVIGGEKDGADYPGGARRVAETVQRGQLYIIPNVGHNPQFEAPQLLYPPLLRFLKGEDVWYAQRHQVARGAVMPCLIGCLALSAPRFAIVLVVLFSDYIGRAYETRLWPLLGFFFMPLTTLAYAWAINSQGSVSGGYLVVVVIAVLMNMGIIGGSASNRYRARDQREIGAP